MPLMDPGELKHSGPLILLFALRLRKLQRGSLCSNYCEGQRSLNKVTSYCEFPSPKVALLIPPALKIRGIEEVTRKRHTFLQG